MRVTLKSLAKGAPANIEAAKGACLAVAKERAEVAQVNREAYLAALTDSLRPLFDQVGFPIPKTVAVSVGFPSRNALSVNKRTIGQCWAATVCEDGEHPHVFIHPELKLHAGQGKSALDHVLAHELIHAACPKAKHRGDFARCAVSIGLEGKMTATHAGKALNGLLKALIDELGNWPGKRLNAKGNASKPKSRMLRMTCACEDNRPIRVSLTQAERGGYFCLLCMEPWILDGEERPSASDAKIQGLTDSLSALSLAEFEEVMDRLKAQMEDESVRRAS